MSEWKEVRLDSLVNRKICYGIVQPGISPESGIPVIKVNNIVKGLRDVSECDKTTEVINNKYKRTILKGGELVMSLVGTVGYVDIVPLSFAGANLVRATGMIDIEDELIKRWVLFYIRTKQGQQYIEDHLNTTVQRALNIKDLCKMPIPITHRCYMEKVVSILSSLDDKIAVNKKICENLETQAQALFKHWFVDFAPFKDGKFVESELGLIPEGWIVCKIEDFCDVFTGKKDVNQSLPRGKYPFFSCSPKHTYSDDYIFDGESIIIAGNGSYTGRTTYYIGKYDLYQRTYSCTVKRGYDRKLFAFLYFMMKCLFEPQKMGGTRGSSIPYIVMKDITSQSFPFNEDYIKKYSDITYETLSSIQNKIKESSRLASLRDTLLPKLMSGEISLD